MRLLGQFDLGQPEIIDALDETFELFELHGLAEVAVCLELVARHDVRFGIRRGEGHRRYRFQVLILLDVGETPAAIHPGKIQVQQDKIRPRRIGVNALTPQKRHGFHTVGGYTQIDRFAGVAEGFLCQPNIAGTIFNEKYYPLHVWTLLRSVPAAAVSTWSARMH